MLKEFNLIASTYRGRENDVLSELWYFLRDLGDSEVKASPTGLPGLTVLFTKLDPFQVVEAVASKVTEEPWYFKFLLKIVPIEVCVPTDLEKIKYAALDLASKKIRPTDSYRIEARIRLSTFSRNDVISAIAPQISNKVNLDNPDKIILIEIIGNIAGVAVLEPRHIVSVQRIKRATRAAVPS